MFARHSGRKANYGSPAVFLQRDVQISNLPEKSAPDTSGMIPMMTPLDSEIMNVILCLAGGVVFAGGLGAVSNTILRKASLV